METPREPTTPLKTLFTESLAHEQTLGFFINGDASVYVSSSGRGSHYQAHYTEDEIHRFILELSSSCKEYLNSKNPYVEATLPTGERVSLFCPPLTQGYSLVLRRPMRKLLPLQNFGIDKSEEERLISFVRRKKNIVVAGATGSGKTTLTSSLLSFIPEHERIVTIEDVSEVFVQRANTHQFFATAELGHRKLVELSLRADPDRIIIGEVRGAEAYDLLASWNTGHSGGITTIHANDATSALSRLQSLTYQVGLSLPDDFFNVIDVIIFLQNHKIKEIKEIL